MSEETRQVEDIRKAFEQEFGRFADLHVDGLAIGDAEALLREVNDVKIRHTGKKSAIAGAMKLISKVASEERGNFGKFVQSVEKEIASKIEGIESTLTGIISKAK